MSDRASADPWPWPPGFAPLENPVFARNELEIPAPPSSVFQTLVDAREWPTFYPNADAVLIEQGAKERLAEGAFFTWRTFSTLQKSRVVLFEADRALGWTADSPGTRAFHRWLPEPTAAGTRAITEECQFGVIASIDRRWMNRSLSAAHQLWLEGIRDRVAGKSLTTR